MVTTEDLDALLVRLRNIAALPAIERFQPGITDEEIDAALAPTGLRAPEELRVLWRWRNGQPDWYPEIEGQVENFYIKSFRIMSATESAADYAMQRALGKDEDSHGYGWPRTLLPIMTSSRTIAAEMDVAPNHPSPIYYADWATDEVDTPCAPSLGTVVRKWIHAIDSGLWRYDARTGHWDAAPVLKPDGWPDRVLE